MTHAVILKSLRPLALISSRAGTPSSSRDCRPGFCARATLLTMSVRSAGNTAVVVEVPVGELAVGLQQESVEMFTVATLPKNRMYDAHDEIYCFVDNQVKRNKWIAVFRRMGVPIFDLSYGHAKELRL
jgi:hypothetical protein